MGSSHVNIVTNNFSRYWIAIRMAFSVFLITLKHYKPFKACRELSRINRRKKVVQGISGVPRFYLRQKKYFYELNTPGWPSEAFTRFMANEVRIGMNGHEGPAPLQNAVISITNRCELNCRHCFEWDRIQQEEHLSYYELENISQQLIKAGVSIIQVGGGEPLERFAECIALARASGPETDFWLLTSGFGLDRFKAELLQSAGYTGINISLDHWDKDKHNEFRGNDLSFRWVQEGAQNTIKAGMVLSLSLCAKREFVNEENLYKYLELSKDLGACFIQILEPRSAGRWKDSVVKLDHDQVKLLSDFREKVNNDKVFHRHPVIVYHGAFQRSHGCFGAGTRYIFIDSRGEAHACPFCQDSFGKLPENGLENILHNIRSRGCHLYKGYID